MSETSSSRQTRMINALQNAFTPVFFEVINESHKHNVPANSETHFNVLVVSDIFEGKNRVQRQRLLNKLLDEEFKSGLHALTQKTWTPAEYKAQGGVLQNPSPPCLGGGK